MAHENVSLLYSIAHSSFFHAFDLINFFRLEQVCNGLE